MTDPSYYVPLAQAAEDAGYDSFLIADSISYPAESMTGYPYNPDGTREFLENKPFIEPFVLMGALSAVTTRLRFVTFVLKLPIRPPALVAKQAMSLAVISGNRFALGVGTSPWPEDYEVLGVPWARRGRRMDECIEIIRGLSSGEWFEYSGEVYSVPRIKMTPAPTEPIPILLGGHGEAALRRAARLGDGWLFAAGPGDELRRCIARLDELRREYGHEGEPFEIHASGIEAFSADGLRELEDLGVTDVIVGFRDPYARGPDVQPLQEKLDHLRRYADEQMAKARA